MEIALSGYRYSVNTKPESHPGKELKEHLQNVAALATCKLNTIYFHFTDYSAPIVSELLQFICLSHDFGKATNYFQDYLYNKQSSELTRHAQFSAVWSYYLVRQKMSDEKLAAFAYFMVSRHHGSLVNFNEACFCFDDSEINVLIKQLEKFQIEYLNESFNLDLRKADFIETINYLNSYTFRKMLRKLTPTVEDYYFINFLFSLLVNADKGDAIFNQEGKSYEELAKLKGQRELLFQDVVDKYKKLQFPSPIQELDKIREVIYNEAETSILANFQRKKIFSLNVPTGTGKTLSALNAALKLRTKLDHNPRIIYVLPFTSIIDQNYAVLEAVLQSPDSSLLIKDHYLADKDYSKDSENFEYDISEYMVESWDSEIIVTTFVQLLHSILTDKNRSLKKFSNIANSIIILDEVQTIAHKYWKLVNKVLLKMTELFDCKIILMTATLPLIFEEKSGEIMELITNKGNYFNRMDRISLFLSNQDNEILKTITLEEFQNRVIGEIKKEQTKSFLFIFNTIQSSLDFFKAIQLTLPDRELIYLSTNIIPKHRLARIKKIKENKGHNFIIISTQVVEAGVDIDIDHVYRDFGPLDSVNQAAGRCNRNGAENKGKVYLFRLKDNKGKAYCQYVYDDVLLYASMRVFSDCKDWQIEEKQFYELSNGYYKLLKNVISEDSSDTILDNMEKLQYEHAFNKTEDNSGIFFRLIDDNVPSGEVFIEYDEKANELFSKYKQIKTFHKFKRKKYFNSFKKEFLEYVIQVPKKYLPDQNKTDFIQYISMDELKENYDFEIGYKRNNISVTSW